MNVTKTIFGNKNGKQVDLFTLANDKGTEVKITNLGGIITEIVTPDKNGSKESVVLGFNKLEQYDNHPYFGCIVGRFANRIAKGKYTIDGTTYQLAINNGPNSLHGGAEGFDKKIWNAKTVEKAGAVGVQLTYLSVDMEENYPGNLNCEVVYWLTNDNELAIEYTATTDKKTIINLTNHSYFNLNGAKSDVLNHVVQINSDSFTLVDSDLIPTGEIASVKGTPNDFTTAKTIGVDMAKTDNGYDHNFILNNESGKLVHAASVFEPASGRKMDVYTTEPGIQFYTGNFLDGTLTGVNGSVYKKQYGFCFEAQHYPDSPNQPKFPTTILEPGKKYSQTTVYKFSL